MQNVSTSGVNPVKPKFPPHLGLLLGVLGVSTASTFIRLAQGGAPSLSVAAWRLTIASVILAPFAIWKCRKEMAALSRRDALFIIASGMFLSLHFYTWMTSLEYTSVTAAVSITTMSPLFVAIASYFLLKERVTGSAVAGMATAIAGSLVIGIGDIGKGGNNLHGDLLALAAAATGTGYFLIGRKMRTKLSLLGYVFPVYSITATILMIAAFVTKAPLSGFSGTTWLWFLMLALIPQIIGHSALNWSLAHLSATYVTTSVLAEPIGATILAWLVLGELPMKTAVAGGALIILGIAVASRAQDD